MDGIFNSPIMVKLQEFGQKLGSNKFLSALQGAMMSSMAPIMVGAIFSIICAIGPMLGLFQNGDAVYNVLYMPYHFTMDLLALWIVLIMAYNYGKALGLKSPIMTSVQTAVCFALIACTWTTNEARASVLDVTYLSSQGMFVSFFVCWFVCQVEKFCQDHNVRIKMPDVCPPSLVNGFSAILPLAFAMIPLYALEVIISTCTGGAFGICSGFMAILSAPLNALVSVPGMFILIPFASLLWCFGIHGTMIIMPVLMPLTLQAAASNAAAFAQGGYEALVFYPVTFGMPIMYNPILCIPYILNSIAVMLCTLIGYKVGFLVPAFVPIMTLMPMGFKAFLGTLRWQNAIWDYLMMIPAGLVWYPFFKVYDNQLYKKEQEALAAEAE